MFVSDSLVHLGLKKNIWEGIADHNGVLVYLNSPIPQGRFRWCKFNYLNKADDTSINDTLVDNFGHFVSLSAECHVDGLVEYFESFYS